jgi:hypothetical protein
MNNFAKIEANRLPRISITDLKRVGALDQDSCWKFNLPTIPGGVRISTFVNDIKDQYILMEYVAVDPESSKESNCELRIPLFRTPCNYGGFRYWFLCTACGGRTDGHAHGISVLYKRGLYFGCRHSMNVTYECRNFSGIKKKIGVFYLLKDVERYCYQIKWLSYKGKPTKRQKRALKYWKKYKICEELVKSFNERQNKRMLETLKKGQEILKRIGNTDDQFK